MAESRRTSSQSCPRTYARCLRLFFIPKLRKFGEHFKEVLRSFGKEMGLCGKLGPIRLGVHMRIKLGQKGCVFFGVHRDMAACLQD